MAEREAPKYPPWAELRGKDSCLPAGRRTFPSGGSGIPPQYAGVNCPLGLAVHPASGGTH